MGLFDLLQTTNPKAQNLQAKTAEKLLDLHGKTTVEQAPQDVDYTSAEDLQYRLGYDLGEQIYSRDDGSQFQYKLNSDGTYAHDAEGNWIEQDFDASKPYSQRNLYIDNTVNDDYKLGLAASDLTEEAKAAGITPYKARYMDQRNLPFQLYKNDRPGYDGTPGPLGVTPEDGALLDVALPYKTATDLEYDVHRNAGMLAERAAGQGPIDSVDQALFGTGKTEYTTQNAPLWNIDYDTENTLLQKDTPLPKKPYAGNKAGKQADLYNALFPDEDGMLGESADIAQSSAAQMYAKSVKLLNTGVRWLAKEAGIDQTTIDEYVPEEVRIGLIGDRQFTAEELADAKVSDKFTGVLAKTREEQQKGHKASLKAIKEGDYLTAALEQFKILPYTLGDSAAEMAALGFGAPGMALAVGVRVQSDAETYEENNGKSPDAEWMLGSTLLNLAALGTEKFLLKTGINGIVEKGMSKAGRTGGVVQSAVGEAGQEYFDQVQQMYMTQKEGDKSLREIATSAEAQLAPIAGGVAGGTLRGAGETVGAVADMPKKATLEKIQNEINRRKKVKEQATATSTEEAETTVDEDMAESEEFLRQQANESYKRVVGKIKNVDDVSYEDLADLESAEEYVRGLDDSDPKKAKSLEAMKNAKSALVQRLEEMDVAKPVTLGSTKKAKERNFTAMVNAVMDIKSGELTGSLDEKLRKIAEANGITEEFYATKKDMYTVEKEATIGKGGYRTYEKMLKMFASMDNPDMKQVNKTIKKATKFLADQERYLSLGEKLLKEVETAINTHNKAVKAKQPSPGVKSQYSIPVGKFTYSINTEESTDGTYSINPKSLDILEKKRENIAGIKQALKAADKEFDSADLHVKTDGFTVLVEGKSKASRQKDATYFENNKVTQALVGNVENGKWKYYNEWNVGNINTGEYTENDTVVIAGTVDEIKEMSKNGSLGAVTEAGATIVMDLDMKADARAELTKQLTKFGRDYGAPEYGNVFMPNEKVEKKKAEIKAEEERKAKAAAVKAKALKEFKKTGKLSEAMFTSLEPYFTKGTKAEKQVKMLTSFKTAMANEAVKLAEAYKELYKLEKDEIVLATEASKIEQAEKDIAEMVEQYGEKVAKVAQKDFKAWKTMYESTRDVLAEIRAIKEDENLSEAEKSEAIELALDNANVSNKEVLNDIVSDSISKESKTYYQYVAANGKVRVSSSKTDAESKKQEGSTVKVVRIGAKKLIDVDASRQTLLNTLYVDVMGKNIKEYADEAKAMIAKGLEKALSKESKGGASAHDYGLIDSPSRMILFGEFGGKEVLNTNVALAVKLVLDEYVSYNSVMLTPGRKSSSDVARMFGVSELEVTKEMVDSASENGVLKKTIANALGGAIINKLGIKYGKDLDAELIAKLKADIGQVAIVYGQQAGLFKTNEMKATTYAKMMDPSGRSVVRDANATVEFVQFKEDGVADGVKTRFEEIAEEIGNENEFRKEASLAPIKAKRADKVAKDDAGFVPPKKAQTTLKKLAEMEWEVNVDLAKEMLKDPQTLAYRLGYVDEEKLDNLSYDERDSQIARNRDVVKSIEEMMKLIDRLDGKYDNSVYFDWFYTKNGRYMMDSNTVNPQVDKWHRFLVQPASHKKNYVFEPDGAVKVALDNGKMKDVTKLMDYALAQAMGYAVDKKSSESITKLANELKALDKKALKKLKKSLMKNGEAKLGEFALEAEHIAHTMQAIDVLMQAQTQNGEVTSSITAEFDAVTSGFALKLIQMPILGAKMKEWLARVGIISEDELANWRSEDSPLRGDSLSMNDVLATKGFRDSYQRLATQIVKKDTSYVKDSLGKLKKSEKVFLKNVNVSTSLWKTMRSVLPQYDSNKDEITGALRNLFKDPFMTFNYSAGIRSIRKSLTYNIMNGLINDIVKGEQVELAEQLAGLVGLSTEQMIKQIKEKPLSQIGRGANTASLEQVLYGHINASYGQQVEDIMTSEFKPFMETHEAINDGFRAMFAVFNEKYQAKLLAVRNDKNAVSDEEKLKIIDELRQDFPYIKGPLSMMEDGKDGVGIYQSGSVTPDMETASAMPAQTRLAGGKSKVVRHMIKEFEAAISAGSVIPIHYIDGALMSSVVNKGISDITAIHDAVMPELDKANNVVKEYNKSVIEIGMQYSFIEEIMNQLDGSLKSSEGMKTRVKFYDRDAKEEVEMSIENYVKRVHGNFKEKADKVKAGREWLKGYINSGVYSMHMAGLSEGVYKAEPKENNDIIDDKELEQAIPDEGCK